VNDRPQCTEPGHSGEDGPKGWCPECREANGLVDCDLACEAKLEPVTLEEFKVAYEHWRSHGLYSGCSHGG
jgi:hypothetical protein